MGFCKKIKEVVIRSYHLRAKVAAKLEKGTKNAEVLGQLVFIASERASQHSPSSKVLEDLGGNLASAGTVEGSSAQGHHHHWSFIPDVQNQIKLLSATLKALTVNPHLWHGSW